MRISMSYYCIYLNNQSIINITNTYDSTKPSEWTTEGRILFKPILYK